MKNIQVFRFRDNVRLPLRGSKHAAGLDIYSPVSGRIPVGGQLLIPTGIGFVIPEGWYGQIAGRSSLNKESILSLPGVIDSDYRGEVKVGLLNLGQFEYVVTRGDRIAQIMFIPCYSGSIEIVTLDQVTETERGENGFGSTGR